jgi:hypothetical protein
MSFNPGSTFVNREARDLPPHLWIVISDDETSQEVVIVNFTTLQAISADKSCVVEPGEHPFVHHRTCVNYRDARVVPLVLLESGRKSGLLTPNSNVSQELLAKIRQGAANSRLTPMKVLAALESQGCI